MLLPLRPRRDLPVQQVARPSALSASTASLFLPGGGQFWQGRYGAGTVHFITCAACIVAAARFAGGWWTVGALVVNVWSSIEAGWWARESGEDPEDPEDPDSREPIKDPSAG